MKLNIGCMDDYKEGWINLDYNKNIKADVYHNLNNIKYPFDDNMFDEVLASMVLEHVDDVKKVIMELHRGN